MVWIEIYEQAVDGVQKQVTTCVVVWIEIRCLTVSALLLSVTTCVVVWIEIISLSAVCRLLCVTTCVVVWIEIFTMQAVFWHPSSPPAWWCGLKFFKVYMRSNPFCHHLRGGVD